MKKEDSWEYFYEELRNIDIASQNNKAGGPMNSSDTDYDDIKGLSTEQVGNLAEDMRADFEDSDSVSEESTTPSP